MGRVKDLRAKVKSGEATEEEIEELKELEEEAKEEEAEASEDEKSISAVAEKLIRIMEAKSAAASKVVEEFLEKAWGREFGDDFINGYDLAEKLGIQIMSKSVPLPTPRCLKNRVS